MLVGVVPFIWLVVFQDACELTAAGRRRFGGGVILRSPVRAAAAAERTTVAAVSGARTPFRAQGSPTLTPSTRRVRGASVGRRGRGLGGHLGLSLGGARRRTERYPEVAERVLAA